MKTSGKDRNPKEVVYGGLVPLPFDQITVGASQANGTVQARIPLGLDFKCQRVTVVPGGAIAGLTSFNVVVGANAEGAVAPDDTSDFNSATPGVWTKAAAGNKMFNADTAVTNTVDLLQTITPTNPEAVYAQGTDLTLRIVSTAAGAGTLKVVLWGKFVDTQPTQPMAKASQGFNPATDL